MDAPFDASGFPAFSQDEDTRPVQSEHVPQKKTEREAIDDVTKRLKKKFPDLPGKHIEAIVESEHESLRNAKLRDYIAVLVEHSAKSKLNKETRKGH